MNLKKLVCEGLIFAAIGIFAACSDTPKSPDVADSIKQNLKSAGFNDVSVSQDRDKGVVTLAGTTQTDADKAQAESIARSIAGNQVVSDQIAVRPTGDEGVAKKVDSDLDKAIEKNFDAALVQNHLDKNVKYDVKVGVITLTGDVSSQSKRAYAEKLASGIPNVRQVVNKLEVKNQKATASKMN
jgi:hyperosmotically inducible periplasmic protein